jgi:FSR family fosmidomycin resistance protein-like MFS transporter
LTQYPSCGDLAIVLWTWSKCYLFAFLAGIVAGTIAGGAVGDRVGRIPVMWFSILGALPFALLLPHANLFWTGSWRCSSP